MLGLRVSINFINDNRARNVDIIRLRRKFLTYKIGSQYEMYLDLLSSESNSHNRITIIFAVVLRKIITGMIMRKKNSLIIC